MTETRYFNLFRAIFCNKGLFCSVVHPPGMCVNANGIFTSKSLVP